MPRTHHRCQTEQAKHPVRGTEEPAGPGGSGREGRCPGPKQAPRATAGRPRPSSHRRDCKDGANYANGPEPAHSKAPRWAEGPGWRSRFPALLPSAPRSRGDTDAPHTPSPTRTLPARRTFVRSGHSCSPAGSRGWSRDSHIPHTAAPAPHEHRATLLYQRVGVESIMHLTSPRCAPVLR